MTDSPQMRLGLIVLFIACKSNAPEPAPGPAAPPPSKDAAATVTEPVLDDKVTGFPPSDPAITLARCKQTSWSYLGCPVVYPVQGRQYVEWQCATITDPATKHVVCARVEEYRVLGIGGPTEREAGLAALQKRCGLSHRAECAQVAAEIVWSDPARAKELVGVACDEDPPNSPVGLCRDIHHVLSKAYQAFAVTVTQVAGVDGVTASTSCRLGIVVNPPECMARLWCGDRALYRHGRFPCKPDGGGEDMTSPKDNDPAIAVDLAAHTVEVHDDASATSPAFTLRGTLK